MVTKRSVTTFLGWGRRTHTSLRMDEPCACQQLQTLLAPACMRGNILQRKKQKKKQTIENILHGHLWKCLMFESYKRVQGLFIIIAQYRLIFSLSLQPHLNL